MVYDGRICFVVNDYPVHGSVGGYGTLTRDIAIGLRDRGVDTCVLVPRHPKIAENIKKQIEFANGIPIFTVPKSITGKFRDRLTYKLIGADIFHHEDVIWDSWLSMRFGGGAHHVITFQDPPTFEDLWMLEQTRGTANLRRKLSWRLKYNIRHLVMSDTVRAADSLYAEARFLIDKSKKIYNISRDVGFLPNPVKIAKGKMRKERHPTVCFLGRWDAQKRPWLFFELAMKFPDVDFIAMGQPQENPGIMKEFQKKYGNVDNLSAVGFVSDVEKNEILEKSWALISTSVREGLPVAFLESLAHETPIISFVNPDKLPERYGFWAKNENFADGIKWLLESSDRRRRGAEGRKYVEEWHATEKVIDLHLKAYDALGD